MGRRHSSLQNNGIPVSTTVPCINLQDTARASPRPCAQCPAIGSIKPGISFAESEYARLHHSASKRLSRLRSSLFQSQALCTRGISRTLGCSPESLGLVSRNIKYRLPPRAVFAPVLKSCVFYTCVAYLSSTPPRYEV